MALIELGSALAAVTATRDDGSGGSRRDGFTPAWTDHAVPPATPGSTHPASVLRAHVPFPSLESARGGASVRADPRGAPPRRRRFARRGGRRPRPRASRPMRRAGPRPRTQGTPARRPRARRRGARDAGVGRDVAADPAWLHALARERRPSAERDPARDDTRRSILDDGDDGVSPPRGYPRHGSRVGSGARAALRAVEAPERHAAGTSRALPPTPRTSPRVTSRWTRASAAGRRSSRLFDSAPRGRTARTSTRTRYAPREKRSEGATETKAMDFRKEPSSLARLSSTKRSTAKKNTPKSETPKGTTTPILIASTRTISSVL